MDVAHVAETSTVTPVTSRGGVVSKSSKVGFTVAAAVLVALFVRMFLIQQYYVVGPSMEPSLYQGDRIIVNKLAFRVRDIRRGDVVVFNRKDGGRDELVKRVIGVPGDTIEIKDCVTYVNGAVYLEPYLTAGGVGWCGEREMRSFYVPDRSYFVMGDNRGVSLDSRKFGAVGESQIEGRVTLVVWPIKHWGSE